MLSKFSIRAHTTNITHLKSKFWTDHAPRCLVSTARELRVVEVREGNTIIFFFFIPSIDDLSPSSSLATSYLPYHQ